jgi:cytochrome c-type biogenesis protein CcmH
MILFWVAAAALSAGAAFLILNRAASAAANTTPEDPATALYRRQLAELDELADRGLLAEAETKSAKAEAGRRLLAAADAQGSPWSVGASARRAPLAVAVAAPILAAAGYLVLGAPGYRDQPFAARMKTWQATDPAQLGPTELAAVLHKLTRERPNDPEGFRYLALAEGASQNPPEAVRALRRAVKLAPTRADLWEMLGEALVVEASGTVTPDAREAFEQTLKFEPRAVVARFQLARAKFDAGDKAGADADWQDVLAELPASDPRRAEIAQAIAQAKGTPSALPPPSGPAADAIAQAAPGDQLAAIKGMVQGLADRLKANPDDPDGWVRLVRAYAVLGDGARRDEALKQAQARYASKPEVLSALKEAASAAPMK